MSRRDTPPNVVLVSIDSLRADHCGFLGDDRGLTPGMDALAAEGVTYKNAIAPGPQTFSSMPAAFTGYDRRPDDVPSDDRSFWERRMAAIDAHLEHYGTLAERLQEMGYSTAGFSPNPWTSSRSGFDRGFDHFRDLSGSEDSRLEPIAERLPGIDADGRALELAERLVFGDSFFARWEHFYDELQETRRNLPEPYFLWVFALDTHYPFVAGRRHREEASLFGTYASTLRSRDAMKGDAEDVSSWVAAALRRSYRDTVRSVDAFVSRLQADVAEDDPVLFVHSDHGESLGEHGNYGHDHRMCYEENLHVPYFVHNAGPSVDVVAPTSLASVHDAVVETGRTGTIEPRSLADSAVVATSECGTHRAVRGRRFKYVEDDGEGRLFDLRSDPGERCDVAEAWPDRLDAHRQTLASFDAGLTESELLVEAAGRVTEQEAF